jgi:hypothetical protein
MPWQRWKTAEAYDYRILPAGMKAWITEYNMFEREGVVAGTWVHGLYAVSQLLLMIQNPRTEITCYHNLAAGAQFAALFNSDQGFARAVIQKKTNNLGFTAAGHCLALIGSAVKTGSSVFKLNFSLNPVLSGGRGSKYPGLTGFLTQSEKEISIFILNLTDEAHNAELSGIMKNQGKMIQLSAMPRQQIAFDSDLQRTEKVVKLEAELRPYSVTVITSSR